MEKKIARKRKKTNWFAIFMLLPAVLFVGVFIVYPLILSFFLSFRDVNSMNFLNLGKSTLSFMNYERIFKDANTWNAVKNSLTYMICGTVFSFLIGLMASLMLNKNIPARRAFRTLVLIPWSIPGIIASLAFVWILDSSYGVMNSLLMRAGLINQYIPWFASADYAMTAVLIPTIWKSYPFYTLMLLASMQSVPEDLYEAGFIDGTNSFQSFIHITWPGIRETAVLTLVLNGLWIFRDVDFIMPSTHGGPAGATTTLAIRIYNLGFDYFKMGTAAALGVITMLICLVFVICSFSVIKEQYFGGAGK